MSLISISRLHYRINYRTPSNNNNNTTTTTRIAVPKRHNITFNWRNFASEKPKPSSAEELRAEVGKFKVIPTKEGEIFSEKIENLAEEVSKLPIVEMVFFLKAVSKRLGLPFEMFTNPPPQPMYAPPPYGYQAGPPPPGAGGPPPQAQAQAATPPPAAAPAPAKEKSEFTVKLVKLDEGAKYKVLKEVRVFKPGMSVGDSKKYVEGLPTVLAENVTKDEAQKWKDAIKAAGGEVEIS